ncbi:MAG: Epimerase protein [Thermodesulfobacteriota bacterium]|nr:Epimerase protein [Thermodesulfobacteriota bacterium]
MPYVLVTGADGFVGKALCAEMVSRGWNIRASVRTKEKIKNLSEGIQIVETGPIGPETDWGDALNNVDAVVHLAGRAHIMDDLSSDPLLEYRIVNTAGTECLAKAAAGKGIRRFIFMSTIKVNGECRNAPYTEEDIPAPADPYGISKWEAEQIIKVIAGETGMETVILRAPMVYGPGVKANFLKLLKAVDRGVPMPLAGIKNKRSMIYTGNMVNSIITCINHPKASGQTYLVSDSDKVSTPELINRIGDALGKPGRLFYMPLFLLRLFGIAAGKSREIERLTGTLTVDSSKIRKELNWTPPFTLIQGLKETAEWYKKTFHTSNQSDS